MSDAATATAATTTDAAAATATAAATTTAATTTAAAAPAAPADWTASIADPDTKNWVTAKGFKDPASVAQSARNLEKLIGGGLDKILKIPGDDTPEAWNDVYAKLGRPDAQEKYSFKAPEGADPKFAEAAKAWFHGAGLNDKQATAITEAWNNHVAQALQTQNEARTAENAKQLDGLKKEWGAAFEQNMQLVDRAAKELGLDEKVLTALRDSMGGAAAAKFLHTLGTKVGEAAFHTGDNPAGFGGALTPAQAQAKIAELKHDKGFVAKYLSKDSGALAEMARLHKMAYPDDTLLQ